MLPCVPDFLWSRQAPNTRGRDDPNGWIERPRGYVHTYLVVALAGTPVSDHLGVFHFGDFDELLCNERTTERRSEGVLSLIDGASLQCWQGEDARWCPLLLPRPGLG